ncbi:carboxypeptidase-like regulatory domain-containing protein [Flavobacteriaceae bacterium F08102]|nr:carboxypeptidase-like regulatory domain-containing protein [Flavobacteriaceae bacterium F08102]
MEGAVHTEGEPLHNATVYLNNTTIGSITDTLGKFQLNVPAGSYELIVSYVGFTTAQVAFNTNTYSKPFEINLTEDANVLEEVIIKPRHDSLRKYHLIAFRESFFGRSDLARTSHILNENALQFSYDAKANILEAASSVPLKIINEGLGYEIEYDLISFTLSSKALAYLGRTQFKPSKGGKFKQKKWSKKRKEAYLGSKTHFVKSLRTHTLTQDGFMVHQFKRVPNPGRPNDAQLAYARNFIKNYKGAYNFSKDIKIPTTKMDTMMLAVRKSSLPKMVDYLYKKNVPYKDMIHSKGKDSILKFDDYLSIIYTKALEEPNYHQNIFQRNQTKRGPQTSAMVLLTEQAILDPSGDIINPLDVIVDGYWGFTGFAQALPLDYRLPEEN